jgi:hypothetical protein
MFFIPNLVEKRMNNYENGIKSFDIILYACYNYKACKYAGSLYRILLTGVHGRNRWRKR